MGALVGTGDAWNISLQLTHSSWNAPILNIKKTTVVRVTDILIPEVIR